MQLPWPILWLDCDDRLKEMSRAEELITTKKVIPWTLSAPLLEESIRSRQTSIEERGKFRTMGAPKRQPKGYIQFLDMLDRAREEIPTLGVRTLVIDPMTRVIEHMARFLQYQTKHGVIEESGWGIYLSNLEEVMGNILAIPDVNKVFIFHSREYRDPDSGNLQSTKPLISGQMQPKVGSYFAEVWHTFTKDRGDGIEWLIQTQPTNWIDCRTSRPLKPIETAYFPALLEKGGWTKPFTVMLFGSFGSGKTTLALSLCDVKEEEKKDD